MENTENNYSKLYQEYMKLQSIPPTKMSIAQRSQLQTILRELLNSKESSEHDIFQYFQPRYLSYQSDLNFIKSSIKEQIAFQEAIIGMAKEKIKKYKEKLI